MPDNTKIRPITIHFNEKWNNARLGFDFSRPAWAHPARRTEQQRKVRRSVYERFGDVGLGEAEPRPAPNVMAYGHRFFGALFGCEIVYPPDQAPCALPIRGDYALLRAFDVPDFNDSAVMERAWHEADLLKREYGFCSGEIVAGSPLNNAVTVFGELFLAAVAEEPETAQHVLRVIMETQFKLYAEFQHVLEPDAYPLDEIIEGYGNCPAIMVSPAMYREVILPVDKEYRRRCKILHLHHCGIFDRYAEMYKELEPDTVEVGAGSDYALMREAFPDRPTSLIIDPAHIEGRDRAAIDRHVSHMVESAAPYDLITSLWTADFSPDMTDENIRDLATAHERI